MITLFKNNRQSIMRLVLLYSYILLFPAFGPVLKKFVGTGPIGMYSAVFLLFLAIGLILQYRQIVKIKILYEVIIVLLTIAFYFSSYWLQMIELAIIGILIARLVLDWIYEAYKIYSDVNVGWYFGIVLALSYGILYLGNVLTPILPDIVVYGAIIFLSTSLSMNWESGKTRSTTEAIQKDKHLPTLLITILIIFIAAGTTYNSIYPALVIYEEYEQFFNVLPFLPTALIAGYFLKKHTFNLLYVGVIFLGFASISLFISQGVTQYFLLQGSIQVAWALLDLFAWVMGARYAMSHNNPRVQAFFVGSFLFGTTLGSMLAELFGGNILTEFTITHALLTLMPLFVSLLIIGLFRLFDSDIEIDRLLKRKRIIENNDLTDREREIALLLIHDYTYSEVSEMLSISINTLKTHTKNLYRKLGVNQKDEIGVK